MSEKNSCCCSGEKTLIMACSGGSNVGQVSNTVMIELDKTGKGSAYCLAGLGGDLSGFIQSTKSAKTILIDGCPVACAKSVFNRHNLKPDKYFVITDLGIEKNHNFDNLINESKIAFEKILKKLD